MFIYPGICYISQLQLVPYKECGIYVLLKAINLVNSVLSSDAVSNRAFAVVVKQ